MTDNKRYYAFDSLRATMMFLGVVIHSAVSYSSSNDMTWPLRAKETSFAFFYLVDIIHSFRMPVFFLIAGFFGASLYFNKNPEQMIKNRFKRILIPFLVFVIVLCPFQKFAFIYCSSVFEGEVPVTLSDHFSLAGSYIPYRLSHLWFLYYLFLISILAYLFLKLTNRISLWYFDHLFKLTFKNPVYRLLTMTGISFTILFLFDAKSFETSVSWLPDAGILIYFLTFYTTGWLLYRNKALISTLKHSDMILILIGVVSACFKINFHTQMNLTSLQILNSFVTSSLSIGIIGIFLRFADSPNQTVSYLVNSAYWVYLIHFFIAVLLSGLIDDLAVSVYLKFLIVLTITTVISLTSYHLFVRKTFIGVFLNGKKT